MQFNYAEVCFHLEIAEYSSLESSLLVLRELSSFESKSFHHSMQDEVLCNYLK